MKKIKIFLYCFTLLLFTFCNNAVKTETVVTETESKPDPLEDSIEQAILAQDTLFDDGTKPMSWAEAGFTDANKFKNFFGKFQTWVAADNIDSIAACIQFPLRRIKTPLEFKEQYSKYFSGSAKKIIAEQNLNRLYRNENGVVIGNNGIWFKEIEGKYYITFLNFH